MSGLRIPIVLGAIGSLIVLVLQNRTPVIQLTFLGMRSRPFSLGLWIAFALILGVIVGVIIQLGGTSTAQSSPRSTARGTSRKTKFKPQGFRSASKQDDASAARDRAAEAVADIHSGWDSAPSNSWDGKTAENDSTSEFWTSPEARTARSKERRRDRRTPERDAPDRDPQETTPQRISLEKDDTSPEPVVEAEYRVVSTPYSRFEGEDDDGFDDAFFDEFFDEDK